MTGRQPAPQDGRTARAGHRFMPKTRLGRFGHLAFWIALFYGLTWGIAKVCEWLSP